MADIGWWERLIHSFFAFYNESDWKIVKEFENFTVENDNGRTLTRSFRKIGDDTVDSVAINGPGTIVGSGISGTGVIVLGSPAQANNRYSDISTKFKTKFKTEL